MQTYIPLRRDEFGQLPDVTADGSPNGGYQCGACGLQGLEAGEPHISSAGRVCEPLPPTDLPEEHPLARFSNQSEIIARADPSAGHKLVRPSLLTPPVEEPHVQGSGAETEDEVPTI